MTVAQGQAMATPDHAIRLRNVTKIFGGVTALDHVDFEVAPGEVHCLAGENGSGKSTLIKIITGVYVPEPGAELSFFGQPEAMLTPQQARLHGIAVIWQDLALFAEMTVAENIGFETLLGNRSRRVNYPGSGWPPRRLWRSLASNLILTPGLAPCRSPSVRSWRSRGLWSAMRG